MRNGHFPRSIHRLFITLIFVGSAAMAHHSPAMFKTDEKHVLTGTVKEFQWTNPHCYIQLLVKDEEGNEVEWSLELGAPAYLYNNGWRPSTLKAGETVSVTMHPLVNGAKGGLAMEVKTADGRELGASKL